MARIIERIPEPSIQEVCSSCHESITLVTKVDCDGSLYPACSYCGDVIENPWKGWKPTPITEAQKSLITSLNKGNA